jgi:hypothetical protein
MKTSLTPNHNEKVTVTNLETGVQVQGDVLKRTKQCLRVAISGTNLAVDFHPANNGTWQGFAYGMDFEIRT